MPVVSEIMHLVEILEEEEFGALAGELLMEISLGEEIGLPDGDETEASVEAVLDMPVDETPLRVAIPDGEQLRYAASFLHLRLVEPVRRLAEAERIAGELGVGREKRGPRPKTEPRRIKFVDTRVESGDVLPRLEAPGDAVSADRLAAVLAKLAGRSV